MNRETWISFVRHAGRGRRLAPRGASDHRRRRGRAGGGRVVAADDDARQRRQERGTAAAASAARSRRSRWSSRAQPGRATGHRQRRARRPTRPAGRHRRRGRARRACWSMPAAGSAPARCWRPSTVRSRRSRRPSSQRRSRRRGPMPPSPSPTMSVPWRSRARGFVSKAEIDSKRATRDAANAQVRVAQAQLGAHARPDRATRHPRADQRAGPRPQRRGRPDRRPRLAARCSASPPAAKWRCGRRCRSRNRVAPGRNAGEGDPNRRSTAASPARCGRCRR